MGNRSTAGVSEDLAAATVCWGDVELEAELGSLPEKRVAPSFSLPEKRVAPSLAALSLGLPEKRVAPSFTGNASGLSEP
jgi:hypothetical protein